MSTITRVVNIGNNFAAFATTEQLIKERPEVAAAAPS
jgi:hypothetical protein